jgi:hypothetical protein
MESCLVEFPAGGVEGALGAAGSAQALCSALSVASKGSTGAAPGAAASGSQAAAAQHPLQAVLQQWDQGFSTKPPETERDVYDAAARDMLDALQQELGSMDAAMRAISNKPVMDGLAARNSRVAAAKDKMKAAYEGMVAHGSYKDPSVTQPKTGAAAVSKPSSSSGARSAAAGSSAGASSSRGGEPPAKAAAPKTASSQAGAAQAHAQAQQPFTGSAAAAAAPSGSGGGGSGRQCVSCGVLAPKMQTCSKCKSVNYCSRECQVAHWGAHKVACRQAAGEQAGAAGTGTQ